MEFSHFVSKNINDYHKITFYFFQLLNLVLFAINRLGGRSLGSHLKEESCHL